MGYFACHSNYIISVLGCTKCNESRDEGTQPGPWEHKRISKKAPRLELYNQNLQPQKKQVGNDLSVRWWNSKVFSAPFANTVCAGGGRGSWLSPTESCHVSRGHSFSQADSRTGTIACVTEHIPGCDWALQNHCGPQFENRNCCLQTWKMPHHQGLPQILVRFKSAARKHLLRRIC